MKNAPPTAVRIAPARLRALRRIASAAARPKRRTRAGAAGYVALFSGADGRGKRLAVERLARELERDVQRVELGSVVGKYIGETEKNLRRVFKSAEAQGAILFFDEADALFGKRSGVRDSHDRYANLETSYLLRRLESYGGLVVLASNLEARLDGAAAKHVSASLRFRRPTPKNATRRKKP